VVLGGGFGNLASIDDPRATVVQVSATGDTFATGPWAFTTASFSGVLNSSASDITVSNAVKTDTDNASNISVATVTPEFESSAFLIGTLYTAGGSSDRLVNGEYELVLGSTGALTLPQGGIISETEVNSSHSILLTPNAPSDANPDMAVKIYPTFNDDDHIHITAGNPATVDLFLGDDDQYVKLEADGGNIVISADDPVGIKWTFGTDGNLTLPNLATISPVDVGYRFISSSNGPGGVAVQLNSLTVGIANTTLANAISADPGSFTIDFNGGLNDVVIAGISGPQGGTNIYTITGTWPANATGFPITITSDDYVAGGIIKLDSANGVNITTTGGSWEFDTDGNLTLPYPGNPGSKIKGGPEGGINSIDLSWELILASGKTIKINPGSGAVVSPTFFAFNSDVVGGGITLPAGSSFEDRGGGVLISGAGQTAVNRFYTKVSNTLYQTVYGGVTYNLIDQSGIWSLDVVGENNPRYTSADLSTWTAVEGAAPAPAGQLSTRATILGVDNKAWTFGGDGTTTLPGAITRVVAGTVAQTGIAYNIGTATALADSTYIGAIVDGSYGPFTLGVVTFTVVVTSGVAAYTVTATTGDTAVGAVIGTLDTGDLGGTSGSTSNISVADVVQSGTAIDLTKSVNKLTDGTYTLADGVEGQIMYLVRQTGTVFDQVTVIVANARVGGVLYTNLEHYPFSYVTSNVDIDTLIFTDGAWQAVGGDWD
jgi:hypothetical protein